MKRIAAAFAVLALALGACATNETSSESAAATPSVTHEQALAASVNAGWRTPEERARDAHRHPVESLTFWGLRPGMSVVEIDPGGGSWWTPILANYTLQTGGTYTAGYVDLGNPNVSENARRARASFEQEYADASLYGDVNVVNFGMTSGLALPDASQDFILVARAFHNWARQEGMTDRYMAEFARVLKPGGVLAVEQHRALEGADPLAGNGYVPESYVIAAAERAGLRLGARSEINANPRDDREHHFGVWTLPPVRRSPPADQPDPTFDRAAYDAIGESDRMTLRFVKP